MINILYLSHTGSIIGGCENQLINLIKNLDRNLYNPVIVCPDRGQFFSRLEALDIPVYACHFPMWRKARAYAIRRLAVMRMVKLAKQVGFPTTLGEIQGFSEDHIQRALTAAKNPQLEMKLKNMPVPLTAAMIDEYMGPVLEAATSGDFSLIKNV